MSMRFSLVAVVATLTLALAGIGLTPQPANAARNWNWWDAVSSQQNMPGCSVGQPSQQDWLNKLGSQDYPHWTELTVYFIAYPCSGEPEDFLEFREWLNYEVHDEGSWKSSWLNEDFYDLRPLVLELDEAPASIWGDGPWG